MKGKNLKYGENNLESQTDELIYFPINEKMADIAYSLGLSPNQITLLSTIFQILAGYKLYTNDPKKASLFYLIGYLLDGADGILARKYKMYSKFGETFDLASDVMTTLCLIFIFFVKYVKKEHLIFIMLITLTIVHYSGLWFGLTNAIKCLKNHGHDNFYKEKKKDLKSESGLFHCIYMTYIKHTYKDYKQNYPNITLEEMYKEINKLRIFGPGNMATALITSLYFAIPIYK